MDTDHVMDFEIRKDGKFGFNVEVGGYGITADTPSGGEYETSGVASIVLDRKEALLLWEKLHDYLGKS